MTKQTIHRCVTPAKAGVQMFHSSITDASWRFNDEIVAMVPGEKGMVRFRRIEFHFAFFKELA